MRNIFKGKAKASNDGDFKTEIPSEDTHDARIVAMIDLGTHQESFQGGPLKDVLKCQIVFELDEEMTGMKGVNHVVSQQYNVSFHEKAGLRLLAEKLLNEGQKYANAADIDYDAMLGQPCTVQITHVVKTTEKGERRYAKVGAVSAVQKKRREQVFKPRRKLTVWGIGQDIDELPDWLPRIYGEEVKDVIARCHEIAGKKKTVPDDEGDIDDDYEAPQTPF